MVPRLVRLVSMIAFHYYFRKSSKLSGPKPPRCAPRVELPEVLGDTRGIRSRGCDVKTSGTGIVPSLSSWWCWRPSRPKVRGPRSRWPRAYGVHPITLANWKRHFLQHGAEVFGGKEEVKAYEKRIAELERMLGQKEVEIALLKNFLRES